jgi:hypothetical protein
MDDIIMLMIRLAGRGNLVWRLLHLAAQLIENVAVTSKTK